MASVVFSNNSTGSPDSYLWDFGDGTQSTSPNPTHAYAATGAYVVRLTAVKAGTNSIISKVVPIQGNAVTSFHLMVNNEGAVLTNNEGTQLATSQ